MLAHRNARCRVSFYVRFWALSFVAVTLAGRPLLAQQPASSPSSFPASIAEQYLFAAANSERTQRGIAPLRWDSALYRAATVHCEQMAARQSISHQYAGEPELATRAQAAGASFSRIAENVAEAPTPIRIHDAWMHSEGHRENLLDSAVDAVGISVLRRNGQLYAVEDFGRSVVILSFDEQEQSVAQLLTAANPVQRVMAGTDEARRTCALETGYAGARRPLFVMRFTAGELKRLPDVLRDKLANGHYREAAVGACSSRESGPFTAYSIAVLLYP